VQRALTEYGYGQLKPTGVVGTDTQAAIQKFEKARKLPVTGQMSDRLVRELATTIGHPVE
jgi:peptidoglycan hydrolase-like protein with peptidoglycan-binding domain